MPSTVLYKKHLKAVFYKLKVFPHIYELNYSKVLLPKYSPRKQRFNNNSPLLLLLSTFPVEPRSSRNRTVNNNQHRDRGLINKTNLKQKQKQTITSKKNYPQRNRSACYPPTFELFCVYTNRQRPTTKISQCCQRRRAAVPCLPFRSPASSRKMAAITLPRQPPLCGCLAKKSPETRCSRRRTKKRKPTKTKSTETRS